MIVIKFFSDWCDDKSILDRILNEFNWEIDSNYNYKYKFTVNDDYTHAIILNKSMPNLKICKDNVIGLSQEPVEYLEIKGNWNIFKDYAKKYIKKYYIGNVIGLEKPFIQILKNAGIEKYHGILAAVEHDFKGYNIKNGEYVDMIKEGIIDPTKVTRTALENAVSVAGTMLITECTIVDDPKEDKEADPMSMMGM